MKEKLSFIKENLPSLKTKQDALRLFGAAALPLTIYFAHRASEVGLLASVETALSRPYPTESQKAITETGYPSEEVLKAVYNEHFKGREDLMPYNTWSKEVDYRKVGLGDYLAVLANLYYKNGNGESFDQYYTKFVKQLHQLSDFVNLDFIVLVSSLKVSGENIEFDDQKEDVDISRVQLGLFPAARTIGLEQTLYDGLGRNGFLINTLNTVDQLKGIDPTHRKSPPKNGIINFNLIRFLAPTTTGMMDFETEERAKAFRASSEKVKVEFKARYPQIATRYEKVTNQRAGVEQIRNLLQEKSNSYIQEHEGSLRKYAVGDPEALSAIGLGENIDYWQRTNYTWAWLENTKIPDDSENVGKRMPEIMRQNYSKDPQNFYKRLLSQQILNPKFLSFQQEHAIKNNDQKELRILQELKELTDKLAQESSTLKTIIDSAQAAEGPLEYDAFFQQLTSVMVTKGLSDQAGQFNPNEESSLYFHLYKVISIREIAPPYSLVNGQQFARDVRIDPPYAPQDVIAELEEFVNILKAKGAITKHPEEDIRPFAHDLNRLRVRSREEISGQLYGDFYEVIDYVDERMISRFYQNETGWKDITKMPGITELTTLLLKNHMLKAPPDKNLYDFYKTLDNLYWDNFDMYPNLTIQEREKVKDMFNKNIRQELQIDPKNKGDRKIVWFEYPPVIRADDVIGKMLYP